MSETISINEAARLGHNKLRLDKWKNPADHIEIDIIAGRPGPWVRLFSPINVEINGKNPYNFLLIQIGDLDKPQWSVYNES